MDCINYCFEAARLQSTKNWPVPYIEPEKLAAAGFYYTGHDDKLKCFECGIEICEWVEGDDVMSEHQRWSPRCRFIRNIECGNVPIGVDSRTIVPPRRSRWDVLSTIKFWPTSCPSNLNFTSKLQIPSIIKLSYLGLGRPKRLVYSDYASYAARLHSFETWRKCMAQTKEQLADAGFFYTGEGDQTICYHCGGGLNGWKPQDDPWEQHAKLFSKCFYLLMVKGQDYVNKITGQHILPPTKEETMQMNLPSFIKKVKPVAMEMEGKEAAECIADPSSESEGSNNSRLANTIGSNAASIKGRTKDVTNTGTQCNIPIDNIRMCKICYNEEIGIVLLPCGHIVACVRCATSLTVCAVCRAPIIMTARATFS